MEYIDVYDANLNYIGREERERAHLKGMWHKTFHCWIASENNGGEVLFQARSSIVKNFPNYLDVSAAGHVLSGEHIDDAIREVKEELGINFSKSDLFELGYRVEVADQNDGQKNREYQSVHILKYSASLDKYAPQIDEVSGLFWLSISDGISLFSNKSTTAKMHGIVYDSKEKRWIPASRTVSMSDFLPRIQKYYLTIFIMCQRILNDRLPVSIS